MTTGRGRPVRSSRNAWCTARGTSPASRTSARHLVIGATVESWSRTSWSTPTSLPMRSLAIWPDTTSMGEEAE